MQRTLAARRRDGFRHAARLVAEVCEIAGAPSLIDDARVELARAGVIEAVQRHDDTVLFDWLMDAMSFQGVSDAAAFTFMEEHGRITHNAIAAALRKQPVCSKLTSWWHYERCGYRKIARTCNQPQLLKACSLPTHDLRNGSLNQAAYGLFLFLRDAAKGDLVRWIDERLAQSGAAANPNAAVQSLIVPLRQIHGLSDKVLSMSLSMLLLAGDVDREPWIEAGTGMVAIDTLVHSWFVRTGILHRLRAEHPYGARCYGEDGCASLVARFAQKIDASRFNPDFPTVFPRFVQHAIWRFCAQSGMAQCNAIRVRDGTRCSELDCDLRGDCDRRAIPLAVAAE